jgi:hypothetical protein
VNVGLGVVPDGCQSPADGPFEASLAGVPGAGREKILGLSEDLLDHVKVAVGGRLDDVCQQPGLGFPGESVELRVRGAGKEGGVSLVPSGDVPGKGQLPAGEGVGGLSEESDATGCEERPADAWATRKSRSMYQLRSVVGLIREPSRARERRAKSRSAASCSERTPMTLGRLCAVWRERSRCSAGLRPPGGR